MTARKQRRIILICVGLSFLFLSTILVSYGMRDGIEFFKTPSQIAKGVNLMGKTLRLGGLVNENSLNYLTDGKVLFEITDRENTIKVQFSHTVTKYFQRSDVRFLEFYLKHANIKSR